METVTRKQILDQVEAWSKGDLTPVEMHSWAARLHVSEEIAFDDWEGDGKYSVAKEALAELFMLDMNLITSDDAGIFLDFLNSPANGFEDGYIKFISDLQAIDVAARKQVLKAIEPYIKYCKM